MNDFVILTSKLNFIEMKLIIQNNPYTGQVVAFIDVGLLDLNRFGLCEESIFEIRDIINERLRQLMCKPEIASG